MIRTLLILVATSILSLCSLSAAAQARRAVPDSVVTALKKTQAFHYADDPAFWQRPKPNPYSLQLLWLLLWKSHAIHWLLYLIVAALVTFVIVKVIQSNNFFQLRRKRKKSGAVVQDETIPQDINARIDEAILHGQLRLAVRLFYLQTLQHLNDLKKITLQAKATNHDYVAQMNTQPEASAFRRLTGIYEYVWYGEFEPNAAQFESIRDRFNQFNRRT